jgi:tetratricopeptide (TPR) repeat protein
MANSPVNNSSILNNPEYRKGMANLQNGDWEKAIVIFEALAKQFPNEKDVLRMLEEARFKANLEAQTLVKPKRLFLPWRSIFVRLGILIGFVFLLYLALLVINREIAPLLAESRRENQVLSWQQQGERLLEAGKLDEASEKFSKVLSREPENSKALKGLEEVERQRKVHALYQEGVGYQEAGDYEKALEVFTEISLLAPQTADVSLRIQQIKQQKEVDDLLGAAEAAFEAGDDLDAIKYYELIQISKPDFQRLVIDERLFALYMRVGKKLREQQPVDVTSIQRAYDYFTMALTLSPRDQNAKQEQFLAQLYLNGSKSFHNAEWQMAVLRLQELFDIEPNYADDVSSMLYEAYVALGDRYKAADDIPLAYEYFRKASLLPVSDVALAKGRMSALVPLLTPTPTPAPTATPTLIPTPTPIPTATPILPTPTPQPLSRYRNKIVFYAEHPDHPGLWLMDASGENRTFYTGASYLEEQFTKLRQQYQVSPDGRYRVYVTTGNDDENPQIYIQGQPDQYGNAPTWKVSQGFKAVCYDPTWSPDGSRILFVSQERGSDDIWVVNVDGSNPQNITPNDWEWDKYPSWSPSGRRIVFWSNREGKSAVYIMDADGRNVKRLGNVPWNEWKPLWIR